MTATIARGGKAALKKRRRVPRLPRRYERELMSPRNTAPIASVMLTPLAQAAQWRISNVWSMEDQMATVPAASARKKEYSPPPVNGALHGSLRFPPYA